MSYYPPHGYEHGYISSWPPMPEPLHRYATSLHAGPGTLGHESKARETDQSLSVATSVYPYDKSQSKRWSRHQRKRNVSRCSVDSKLQNTDDEPARKSVDPPVVVQMRVEKHADTTQYADNNSGVKSELSNRCRRMFLHNPYLFVVTTLLYEDYRVVVGPSLTGTTTSSLHRLKEVDEEGNWGEGMCNP